MKIKAVCEKTGLTDRTIRYYIEEGLISPSYTENYLGRKAFDFSEENITELNNIAILRNFDFSIEEIRGILIDPESSPAIIREARQRVEKELLVNQKKVSALTALNGERAYTVAELAGELSKPDEMAPSNENIKLSFSKRLAVIARASMKFIAVWLPIVIGAAVVTVDALVYENPVLNPYLLLTVIVLFVPSLVSMFISKIKLFQKPIPKKILLWLCVLCIPLCAIASFGVLYDCGHEWTVLAVEGEVSCTGEGRVIKKCDVCGGIDVEILEKLPHNEVIEEAIHPTCERDGSTEGRYCAVCNEVITAKTKIPKLSHTLVKTYVKATCSSGGYTHFECSVCGHNYKENIVLKTEDHVFVKNGNFGYRCKDCSLEVCKYGYADGLAASMSSVKYYITGVIDDSREVERTLVIYGSGSIPAPAYESFHPWRAWVFAGEIRHVVIGHGITAIGNGAFAGEKPNDNWMGNPFHSIESFVIMNKNLKIDKNSPHLSGIECEITYGS